MKVITSRQLIRDIAQRWRRQYPEDKILFAGGSADAVYQKLLALDVETATAVDVKDILKNDGWVTIWCDECCEYFEKVIQLGQEPDYESATVNLCGECLEKAVRMFTP